MLLAQGMDVLQHLLSCSELSGLPPVVAMTGNASQLDKDRYEAAGFAGTLGKPFSAENIAVCLSAILSNRLAPPGDEDLANPKLHKPAGCRISTTVVVDVE